MKIIANCGISTKNVPFGSRDSFLLGIHASFIDGICINTTLTRDGKIVPYHPEIISKMGRDPNFLRNHTLEDIQKYNIGNKVQKHSLLELSEILELFMGTTKILILQLNDQKEHNCNYIDELLLIVDQFPNVVLYLKTNCKEIFSYLQSSNCSAMIGSTFDSDRSDFYCMLGKQIEKNLMKEAITGGKVIMIEEANSKEVFSELCEQMQGDPVSFFLITDNSAIIHTLKENTLVNYKKNQFKISFFDLLSL